MIIEIVCARGKRKTDSIMRWTLHESLTVVLERTFSTSRWTREMFQSSSHIRNWRHFYLFPISSTSSTIKYESIEPDSAQLSADGVVIMRSHRCASQRRQWVVQHASPETSSKYLSISDLQIQLKTCTTTCCSENMPSRSRSTIKWSAKLCVRLRCAFDSAGEAIRMFR